MAQIALLVIDPQNSFCNPGDADGNGKGSLYVDGADADMKRLADWILKYKQDIDALYFTLDSHHVNDIAHPGFWINSKGQKPAPFTQIKAADVKNGTWTPLFEPEQTLNYLKALEKQGEYPHLIWPPHCIIGSEGAAVYPPVMQAFEKWAEDGKFFNFITKGEYPLTEHFGAFKAQISDPDILETQLNEELLEELSEYDIIYVAGEARSHCVANSIKQILDEAEYLTEKLVILEDTMSNVKGFETLADPIYARAEKAGVRFAKTSDDLLF